MPPPQQQQQQPDYNFTPPRPYVWKTDEYQTQNEPRKTASIQQTAPPPAQFSATPNYPPAPLAYHQGNAMEQAYLCPHCLNRFPPRYERRISTTGWIVFAVLLVTVFPFFWIGLCIREDVWVCQSCNARLA